MILTTHEIAYADENGQAHLSSFGQQVWDELVNGNDQVFLTLNGHFWPPGRAVMGNKAGNDVQIHITNYQNRYYGGAGMIRLYHFDLARDTIDVQTVAPWILGQPAGSLNLLQRQEIELTSDVDYFTIPLDLRQRFAGFDPIAVPCHARPGRSSSRERWRTGGSTATITAPSSLTASPSPTGQVTATTTPRSQCTVALSLRCGSPATTIRASRRRRACSSTAARTRYTAPTCRRFLMRR